MPVAQEDGNRHRVSIGRDPRLSGEGLAKVNAPMVERRFYVPLRAFVDSLQAASKPLGDSLSRLLETLAYLGGADGEIMIEAWLCFALCS